MVRPGRARDRCRRRARRRPDRALSQHAVPTAPGRARAHVAADRSGRAGARAASLAPASRFQSWPRRRPHALRRVSHLRWLRLRHRGQERSGHRGPSEADAAGARSATEHRGAAVGPGRPLDQRGGMRRPQHAAAGALRGAPIHSRRRRAGISSPASRLRARRAQSRRPFRRAVPDAPLQRGGDGPASRGARTASGNSTSRSRSTTITSGIRASGIPSASSAAFSSSSRRRPSS